MNENELKIIKDLIINIDDYFQEKGIKKFDRDIAVAIYILNENLKLYEPGTKTKSE